MRVPRQSGGGGGSRVLWWVVVAAVLLLGAAGTALWQTRSGGEAVVAGTAAEPTVTVAPAPADSAAAQPTPAPTPAAQPTPAPTPAPTTESARTPPPAPDEGQALPGASQGPFTGAPESQSPPGSWIRDVRSAWHEGYDRVVIEFNGSYVPTYVVGYTPTTGPFLDIPGDVVPVAGQAFLDVWLQGTSRNDMSVDGYPAVYTGSTRVASDTQAVTEVVLIEDFEANVHWIIGLDQRHAYTVWTMTSPSRLVIDIEH